MSSPMTPMVNPAIDLKEDEEKGDREISGGNENHHQQRPNRNQSHQSHNQQPAMPPLSISQQQLTRDEKGEEIGQSYAQKMKTNGEGKTTSSSSSSQSPRQSLRVVITGGTKGLGRALAEEFLHAGDKVLIGSRNGDMVRRAVSQIKRQIRREGWEKSEIAGAKCDVTQPEDLLRLANQAKDLWGGADIWICNAATNGYLFKELEETPTSIIREVAATNIMGTLLTAREAIRSMRISGDPGMIILLEGAGGGGDPTPMYAAYGVTKAGVRQLASSLTSELRTSNLEVVTLNPGLVDTELLRSGEDAFGRVGQFLVNIIVSKPSRVAAEVVPKIREMELEKINQVQRRGERDQGWLSRQLKQATADYRSIFPRSVSVLTPRNILRKVVKIVMQANPLAKLLSQTTIENLGQYINERQNMAKRPPPIVRRPHVLKAKLPVSSTSSAATSVRKDFWKK
mmetsp:Transcript_30802/g.52143  ORF Transcript_30802/g.52143 Transcript_30802/m.52143 type:complete len:455 (-) Transcript_30802:308-1672(-)